jgi:hypothetical protein
VDRPADYVLGVLNPRLYRAALLPCAVAVAVAALSLGSRPAPLTTSLAPDAFEGQRAVGEAATLAAQYPSRRPGSPGDEALAAHIAGVLRGLGGTAGGGFSVRVSSATGATIEGSRRLETVIAQRPGSTAGSPIVIVAHRDAPAAGAEAQLSGTAVLLGLARVFAGRETRRAIVLVSTSGGSGGAAGAAALAAAGGPLAQRGGADAAIVLGDMASARARMPEVIPYSSSYGLAPLQLARTVSSAVRQQQGRDPGAPSVAGQLAHLAVPLAPGEQAALDAAGLPAVLLQASGEAGPAPRATVSGERVEALGRAVLQSVDALDTAPDVEEGVQRSLVIQHKTLPAWALALLALTLLLAPAVTAVDGLARAGRRRLPIGRGMLWTASCALPFLACALLAYVLGALGILDAPPLAVQGDALALDARVVSTVASLTLTFLLAWLLWAMLMRRLDWGARPDGEVVGLAIVLLLAPIGLVVWAFDPYTALLVAVPANVWLVLATAPVRLRRGLAAASVALGLLPFALLLAFYCHQLGLDPIRAAWTAAGLLAAGAVGPGGALLWSLCLGAAAAAMLLALLGVEPVRPIRSSRRGAPPQITIRGPLTYAGPGSLGGTESALRR